MWFDWLPEVLMGLRMLSTRAHGHSPFVITYKQDPLVPGRPMEVDPRFPLTWESALADEDTVTTRLVELFFEMRAKVVNALLDNDGRMKRQHDQSELHEFTFVPGDLVIIQQRRVGKLIPKAEGPFTFVCYSNAA